MRYFLILVFFLFSFSGHGETKRVLFIGNSYTLVNNLPQITASIAASMGDELIFGTSAYSSYSLQMHWENSSTLDMIRQGYWNYVVLQEYSQYPSEPLAWVQVNVFPYAQYLNSEINTYNSGAETMFYMTWGRRDGDAERCARLPEVCTYIGMDNLTRERYMLMAQANNGVVSPVGAVWRYIRENYPSIELYDPDGSHPSTAGSYAAACCFYTAIFKKDPGLISYNYAIDPADASKIRTAAREVVFYNMATWYLDESNDYTITASSGTGGTISPSGNVSVNAGATISFSISPNTGYHIADVKVDNVAVGAVSSYTFNSVSANHTISAEFAGSASYTITASAGSGGSISPSGNITVYEGTSRTFNITPSFGYQISDCIVDGNSRGAISTYTFSNISASHTISASFTVATYTINASAGYGGSVSPSGTISATHGTSRTFTVTPSTGYKISDVRVDNVSVGDVSSYTFSNITSNHTISATFDIITYTIASSAGTGGSISPQGNVTVEYGSEQTFNITPNTGYNLSDVKVDNVSVGPVSSYTFRNITGNHSISATFSIITFKITGSSGTGGSISPSGVSTVNYGSGSTYIITPNTGFRIYDVKIDNVSAGVISSYSFNNVTSDHTISASFTPITFNINSTSGTGGLISPQGTTTVNYGTNQVYSITPATGYKIVDVKVDNKSVGPVSDYTFTNIIQNHTISASFNIITYIITAESNSGGSISPNGKTVVNYGSDLSFTFKPDYGFRIYDVTVDGKSKGTALSYTLNNITDNHNISVIFEPIPTYMISAFQRKGGSVTPAGSVTLFEGSDQTYLIIPEPGYRILDVAADNYSIGALSEFTFSNITSNHTIIASFTSRTDVNVYPNPFPDEFNIQIASPEGYLFDLVVADVSGKIIYDQSKVPGNTRIPINLKAPQGLYFVRLLLQGKKIAVIKVIKS